MEQTTLLQSVINRMKGYTEKKHLVVGFDGFVDEIIHVVDKRKDPMEYQRIRDITSFSERIAACAGLSANIELVPTQTKLGGNGPIMGNSIIALGQEVTYIGALGKDQIDPVFSEFAGNCRTVYSLTDPGHTDALEFYDGKIMLGKMNNLVEVSHENLEKVLPAKELLRLLAGSDMVGFTNWTMLSNLNGIIEAFGQAMQQLEAPPAVFIDLADPKKRTSGDIRNVLGLIGALPCKTILGMNLSESTIIAEVLEIAEERLVERASAIRKKTGIDAVLIHPVKGAAVSTEEADAWVDGPYTKKPRLTTGAGDNFNAGFCHGWLGGFSPAECLMTGVCNSGFYVRNGRSPSHGELLAFMEQWHSGAAI